MAPSDARVLPIVERLEARLEFGHEVVRTLEPALLNRNEQQRGENRLKRRSHIRTLALVTPRVNHVSVPNHAPASAHQFLKRIQFLPRQPDLLRFTRVPLRA